ncbi:hypothetical protein GTW69_00890 [Streptomyces sp. SID7760]|nr:hypothetical protein [Streptomyces sp. SID7760]
MGQSRVAALQFHEGQALPEILEVADPVAGDVLFGRAVGVHVAGERGEGVPLVPQAGVLVAERGSVVVMDVDPVEYRANRAASESAWIMISTAGPTLSVYLVAWPST